ncbi:AfsR/SARP family transcriptional regulator, partial [Streptomyces hundungensis]
VELRSAALELLTPAGEEHSPAELPVSGTVLLAVGMAELAGGRSSGVRLLALAERMRVHRDFPTMSAARARAFAEDAGDADGAAYADAVSEYAALGRDELAAAAVLVLRGISAGDRG